MSKKINMENPNVLASNVVKEHKGCNHACALNIICQADIGMTTKECRTYLFDRGYVPLKWI